MRRLFNTRVRIILAFAVIAALLTVGCKLLFSGQAAVMNNAVSTAMNPLRGAVTAVVNRVEVLYDYIFGYEKLKAENELLREEMAEKNEDIRESQTYKEENDRLRTLLELSQKHTDFELEIANVVAWGSTSYSSTMTISKGSGSGLEAGMCVITEDGQVVGLVSETGTNWATVTTILDSTSEIGAYVFGSGYTCIAQGSYELTQSGTLQASYLDSEATIHNNDQVLTSGDGDVYPAGLMIGTISDVGTDEASVSKYAIVTPSVDISSLSQVFVIKSFSVYD